MLANEDKNGHDIEHWRMMMIILIMITRITRTEYWNTSHETLLMSHNIQITPILQGFTIRKQNTVILGDIENSEFTKSNPYCQNLNSVHLNIDTVRKSRTDLIFPKLLNKKSTFRLLLFYFKICSACFVVLFDNCAKNSCFCQCQNVDLPSNKD